MLGEEPGQRHPLRGPSTAWLTRAVVSSLSKWTIRAEWIGDGHRGDLAVGEDVDVVHAQRASAP